MRPLPKDQPTKRPTRKVWAAIIAAGVIAMAQAAARHFLPGTGVAETLDELTPYVSGAIVAAVAYLTREWGDGEPVQ